MISDHVFTCSCLAICVSIHFIVKVGVNQQPITVINGAGNNDDDKSTLSLILIIVFIILAAMILTIIIYAIAHYMYLRTKGPCKPPVEA